MRPRLTGRAGRTTPPGGLLSIDGPRHAGLSPRQVAGLSTAAPAAAAAAARALLHPRGVSVAISACGVVVTRRRTSAR